VGGRTTRNHPTTLSGMRTVAPRAPEAALAVTHALLFSIRLTVIEGSLADFRVDERPPLVLALNGVAPSQPDATVPVQSVFPSGRMHRIRYQSRGRWCQSVSRRVSGCRKPGVAHRIDSGEGGCQGAPGFASVSPLPPEQRQRMMVTLEAGRLSDVSGTANGMMCVPSHGPEAVPSLAATKAGARWDAPHARAAPFPLSPKEGSSGGVGW
jgi:hypothetical protein